MRKSIVFVFVFASLAFSQTTVNGGRTILGLLDASGAIRTAPVKSGTTAPVTCAVGDIFFKTDATAGQNLYFCTATNTWTQMTGGGGGAPTGAQYLTLTTDGTLSAERVLTPRDSLSTTDAGANGAYTVDWNPLDRSVLWMVDDFVGGYSTNGDIGQLGWSSGGDGSVVTPGASGDANHTWTTELRSGTVSTNAHKISLGYGTTGQNLVAWNSHPWEMQWIFQTGASVASLLVQFALCDDVSGGVCGGGGYHSFRFRYDSANDSAWVVRRNTGGNDATVCTASEIPVVSTWYRLVMATVDGTNLTVKLYKAGSGTDLFTTPCTSTTFADTTGMGTSAAIQTLEAVQKVLTIDWFSFKMRGLSR